MPTILKVNVSRKVSQDFQSRGYGLEIQTELPTSAASNPNEMAEASDELFRLAEDLLEEQVRHAQGNQQTTAAPQARQAPTQAPAVLPRRQQSNGHRGNGTSRANGQANANGRDRPVTAAQVRAINKMAEKLDTNGDTVAQEDFGKSLNQLTLKEASQAIDNLRNALDSQPAQGGR